MTRQVPQYLIIGNGRVSRHFQYYFQQLAIPFQLWDRSQHFDLLQQKILHASHILILIKDDAIESFIKAHLLDKKIFLIHFSGSLVTDLAFGAHPLMSFNENQYSLLEYQSVPFVLDHDAPEFKILFPDLPNPHIHLNKKLKPKYHALCVMSGNFSCLLWQKLFADFERVLKIPSSFAHPYLKKQTENLLQNYQNALTGPLVRNDQITMQKNLDALKNDPFEKIYENFILCYRKMKEESTA